MQTPKFLQEIKTRLFATGATTVGTIGATAYLASVPQAQLTQNLESAVGTFLTAVLMATAPPLANAFVGIATNLISGDIYDRFTKKEFYKQIPPEANLYQATFFAFQSILNEVLKKEENRADRKQIKKLRDISLETWIGLVSLDEQNDNISEVAEAILTKFDDEKIINNQFQKINSETQKNLLSRQDWLILLLKLQSKENDYLPSELEEKVLDALEKDFTTRLRSVFSNHQETFQEITLQLWKNLFEKLDVIEMKVDDVPQKTAEYLKKEGLVKSQSTPRFLPKNFPEHLPYFAGREKVLENITESLQNHGTAAFADTHGVGKSSVVNEFAHRNKEKYAHILFIRATNNEFDIYVSDIVRELGFDLPNDVTPEQRLEKLQEWLAQNQGWLLLIDNVDDVDFIHKCGFNKPNGQVIYTSNDEKIFKVGIQVKLPRLSDENAMLLLYKHWQDDADAKFENILEKARTALKGIAEKFGNHPFSMAFVGSYLAEEDESLEEFLEAYQSKEKNLLEKYKFLSGYQHEEVATAFLLRFEQISTPNDDTEREQFLSIAVKDYLKLSAYVGTDNIPEELLQQSLIQLYPNQADWTENRDFIKDIYKRFKPTGIFKRDAENKTLSTHRIVQEIMRFQIKDEEKLILETLADTLSDNFEEFDFTNKEEVERYLPHAGKFFSYLEESFSQNRKAKDEDEILSQNNQPEISLINESVGILCNNYADYYRKIGQYEVAEIYSVLTKNICESIDFIDQILLATSYNNLALVYVLQGKYEEVESLYIKAINILERFLGENHYNTALSYNNLAEVYRIQVKYEEAEYLFNKAIAIFQKEFGEDHPNIVQSYNNLALLYYTQGKYEEAEALFIKAIYIRKKELGENHPKIALSYNGLAFIYYAQGRYEEAEPLFIKAINIYEKFLSENHPDVAQFYGNLASLYYSQDRYKEAKPLFIKTLKIREKALGENHPDTAQSYNNLALLCDAEENYKEAESLYVKASNIFEKILGENHPDTAINYNNLAEFYRTHEEYEKAEYLFNKAIAVFQKEFGEEHPKTAQICGNLALLYDAQDRDKEAEVLYIKAIKTFENILGKNHPDTALSYMNFGIFCHERNIFDEALELCEKALTIFQKTLSADHLYFQHCADWIEKIKNSIKNPKY